MYLEDWARTIYFEVKKSLGISGPEKLTKKIWSLWNAWESIMMTVFLYTTFWN